MSPDRRNRFAWAASLLVPLGFVHVLLFLRIPLDVYLAGSSQIVSAPWELAGVLALMGLASLLGAGLVLAVAGHRIPVDLRVWLTAAALVVWIMDSFWVRSYPLLDGTVPRIEPDRIRLVAEGALLIALIGALAARPGKTLGPLTGFLGLLLVLNLWSVASDLARLPAPDPVEETARPPAASPWTMSREDGVLVVLMDTFQSGFLDDALAAEPALGDAFDGFTAFPDTLGVAPTTFLSLPAIHSGRAYDPTRSMSGYFDAAVREQSFLSRLADQGYRATLVNPIRHLCPAGVSCVGRDGLLRARRHTAFREALHLIDIASVRLAPESAKNLMFDRGRFRLGRLFVPGRPGGEAGTVWDDHLVLQQAARRMEAVDDAPRALFVHLMSTHPPYVLDADCGIVNERNRLAREHAIAQVRCALRGFTAMLERLRSRGLYDDTLIVLVGDHGYSSALGEPDLDNQRLTAPNLPGDPRGHDPETEAGAPSFGRLAGGANPLLLVKPPGAHGPLKYSERQAALTDIAATVCSATGGCEPGQGSDLLASDDGPVPTRTFLDYTWEHRFWELGYIPELAFYEVQGPLFDPGSWEKLPLGLRRERIERFSAVTDGRQIAFGEGWAAPEPDGSGGGKRWAVGDRAVLTAELTPGEPGHVAYQLDLQFYTPPFIGPQAVTASLNGEPLGRRPLPHRMDVVSFRLPAERTAEGPNRIELSFDRAVVPEGPDTRELASSLFHVTLSRVLHRSDN